MDAARPLRFGGRVDAEQDPTGFFPSSAVRRCIQETEVYRHVRPIIVGDRTPLRAVKFERSRNWSRRPTWITEPLRSAWR